MCISCNLKLCDYHNIDVPDCLEYKIFLLARMNDEQIYNKDKCIAALQFPSVPEPQPHGKGGRCRGRPDKEYLHILSLLVATGSKESPTANPKPNDKSAGNGPKQQTGNFGIGDSTRENPTVPAAILRERFRAAGFISGGRKYPLLLL
ncbi:MAG: hypothetical protein BHV68_21935 [Bacteroidales bacterium 43_8]|jgi:hypothetical protein|nr:MAG: hypothetical protein BHV68_21935 [Bacteroidales bacterium 43_8]